MLKVKCGWIFLFCILSVSSVQAFDYDINIPKEIETGKWFDVNISVYSEEATNFSVYSYVYKGFENIGQGWIANKQEIELGARDSKDIILSDLVKYNTKDGLYNLRVRFKFSETENLTETYLVKVIGKETFTENYLYAGLVALSIVGVGLAFLKKNR